MNKERLMKMAGAVRTGGKGTMRRKKKAVHKVATNDDKKLQITLKKMGANIIPGIEEVNFFKDDIVLQFSNPKVQASIAANTWAITGSPQTKKLQDILPDIIQQLGMDNYDGILKMAEQIRKELPVNAKEENYDDVPELVPGQTFEDAANEGEKEKTHSA